MILTTGTSIHGRVKPINGPPIITSCSAEGQKPASSSRWLTGVPRRAQTLPGRLTDSPVKVTTRSVNGSPSITARFTANAVPTFCINTPMSDERPPCGTCLPVRICVNCFAPPEGYLVGITRRLISCAPASTARSIEIACGLLSSMPIKICCGCRICPRIRIPSMTCAAQSCISRSSAVIYGSHSAALIIRVVILSPPPRSFVPVGKPAPPSPATPN